MKAELAERAAAEGGMMKQQDDSFLLSLPLTDSGCFLEPQRWGGRVEEGNKII